MKNFPWWLSAPTLPGSIQVKQGLRFPGTMCAADVCCANASRNTLAWNIQTMSLENGNSVVGDGTIFRKYRRTALSLLAIS
jgi:hypothetical protein